MADEQQKFQIHLKKKSFRVLFWWLSLLPCTTSLYVSIAFFFIVYIAKHQFQSIEKEREKDVYPCGYQTIINGNKLGK